MIITIEDCPPPGGAGGSSLWEVIGDTTVSSPVTSISHNVTFANYVAIRSEIIDLEVEQEADESMYLGLQLQQAGGTVDFDLSARVTVATTIGVAKCRGAFTTHFGDHGGGTDDTVMLEGAVATTFGGSPPEMMVNDGYIVNGRTGTIEDTTKVVYFFSSDSSDFDVATASDIDGGRIITYGLKKTA